MSTDFVSLFTGMSERDIGYILKGIVQRSINKELTESDLSNVDNKTPVLLTNSKDTELLNDISIQTAINIETPTQYIMTEEPDGKDLKLWLKFHNAGQLRDWSYQKNKAYAVGSNTMPGLFYRTENDNMLKTELYSYFDGHNHYAYSTDAVPVQIKPNITASKITSFFMRLAPVSLAKLNYAENNSLFTKVDDDQLRYGYSVTIDGNGSLHFYVKNDYKQYHLFVKNAYNHILTDPLYQNNGQYRFENFNTRNFITNYAFLCSLVDSELPFDDWFFKYNPTTHNMSVIRTIANNNAAVFADTSLIATNPVISLPIQDGKYTHSGTVQTTVYDNSNNGNNGTITNITTGGQWNDDNSFTCLGATGSNSTITFSSISAINTLTEFTVAFWFNPLDEIIPTSTKTLVHKGLDVAQSFKIQRQANSNNVVFTVFDTSVSDFQTVTFPNAFPNANTWYFIVAKWKSGEKAKISINNAPFVESSNIKTFTLTNSSVNMILFGTATSGPYSKMALFRFYTSQISQALQDDLYYQGYHNPLFPKSENIQPVQDETPDPVLIPFSNVYTLDKMTTPAAADYRKINSLAGDNPLVQLYSVADGTSTVDPELLKYNVPDGTGGPADPFVIIQGPGTAGTTLESSDPSNGRLGNFSDGNRKIAMRVKTTGATIGTNIQGKKITKAVYDMRRMGPVTGTIYCKIWDAAGAEKGTIGSVSANSLLDGTYGAVTFQNLSQSFTLPTGSAIIDYRIGLEYTTGGSGDEVQVRRKSNNLDDSVNQDSVDWDETNWTSSGNTGFEVKCNLFTGQGTSSTDPNISMGSGSVTTVAESFGSATTHNLLNQIPRKIVLRLKKSGTPSGTFSVVLMNATGTVLATFSGPTTANSLTTTTADYTFTNLTHTTAITNGIQIAVSYGGTGGNVIVMTNLGNTTASNPDNTGGTNNYHGSTSYTRRYQGGWTNLTGQDVSMKVYTGGTSFDAYVRLSDTRTRVATKAVSNQSSLHNDKITKVVARIKKVGNPAGIITARIRDPNDVQRVLFSSVDVNSITANGLYNDVEFTNFTHTYRMNFATGSGDKVVYEFTGSTTSNYLEFNANKDVFDNTNVATITQTYENGNYVDDAQRDLAGKMYTGGEPDLTSRTRVAQSIEHQDSRLKGKKITRVKAFLYRTTTATSGTVYCSIRRGSDNSDELIKTLGLGFSVSSLSTNAASPTQVTFEDTTNNYPMSVGDKVTIEFNGGSATNAVGVLVRTVTPNYDGTNSYIRKYDETDYDDEEPTKDLCAVMDEGGFMFTPDPNDIPDPTPVNDKDLILCAGNNKKSGFFECFLMEFRIYTKNITTDQADNLYSNRYSISPIGPGQVLMPLSLKANTLDPV